MSSRYLDDLKMRKSKIIHVYRNGDKYSRAALILLKPIEQKELDRIFRAIEEKITLPSQKPIKRIYTIEGDEVEKSWQIEDQSYYVVGSTENFIKTDYGTTRYWTILGPVRWSKCSNVIYEPPEQKEMPTSRSTYDQWKLRITNSARPSSKMTKSMSAFPHERKVSKKDKKNTLTIVQVRRPVSEPSNDMDSRIIQDELGHDIPDNSQLNCNPQMEEFLENSVKMSTKDNEENKIYYGIQKSDNIQDTKEKGYDVVTNIAELTSDVDNSDRNNTLAQTGLTGEYDESERYEEEEEEEDSLEKMDEETTDENINKFKEREEEISDEESEDYSNLAESSSIDNKQILKHMENVDEADEKIISRSDKNVNESDYIEKYISEVKETQEKDDEEEVEDEGEEEDEEEEDEEEESDSLRNQIREGKNNKEEFLDYKNIDLIKPDEDVKTDDEISILKEDDTTFQENYKSDDENRSNNRSKDLEKDLLVEKQSENINEKNNKEEDGEESDNSLYEKEKAALLIQANFRGNMKKRFGKQENKKIEIKADLELKTKEKAATVIQSNFRGHMVRESFKNSSKNCNASTNYDEQECNNYSGEEEVEDDLNVQEKAATIIQSHFRGHLVRENMEPYLPNLKENNLEEDHDTEEKAATIIQSNFRGHLVRENMKGSTDENKKNQKYNNEQDFSNHLNDKKSEDDIEAMEKAAVVIQSNFRGHLVREGIMITPELRRKNLNDDEEDRSNISGEEIQTQENEALIIQSNCQGHLIREDTKTLSEPFLENISDDELNHRFNSEEEMTEEDLSTKEKAAIVIQSNFRGHLVRDGLKNSSKHDNGTECKKGSDEDDLNSKEKAAIVIQSNFHGHLVRDGLKNSSEHDNNDECKKGSDEDDLNTKEKAAIVIQSNFRGHLVREDLKKSSEHNENISYSKQNQGNNSADDGTEESSKEMEKAAILIQSNFRGYLTRSGLKSSSNDIGDYQNDDEEDRSYAAHDSDDDDD